MGHELNDMSHYEKNFPKLSKSIRNQDKKDWLENRIASIERQLENCRYNSSTLNEQLTEYEQELLDLRRCT
jgi:CII-binding regulator of phage lambda lysogenization HflD